MSRESVAGAERLFGIGCLKYGVEGWTWGSWKSGSMTRIDTIAVGAVGGSSPQVLENLYKMAAQIAQQCWETFATFATDVWGIDRLR